VHQVVERDGTVLFQIKSSRGDDKAVQGPEAKGAVHPCRGGGPHGWTQDPGGGDEALRREEGVREDSPASGFAGDRVGDEEVLLRVQASARGDDGELGGQRQPSCGEFRLGRLADSDLPRAHVFPEFGRGKDVFGGFLEPRTWWGAARIDGLGGPGVFDSV
jgi:hypothetical protein